MLYVGGQWQESDGGTSVAVVDPATEQAFAEATLASAADVDRAVAAAVAALPGWGATDPAERIALVRALSAAYRERRKEMAALITREMGSPIAFGGFSQATLPQLQMEAFADHAEAVAWEERRPGRFGQDVVLRREPVGVVAAIVPWNMPQVLIIGKLVPALLAGCPVVVKAAPETPLDALLLAEIIHDIGFPAGVVSILPGDREAGAHLVGHPGVDKVSFTGSTAAGRHVAAACGAALTRVSLELGGKSAAVVLDDADPAAVADGLKVAGLMNSGQACVAQTRILVPETRRGEHVEALAAMVSGLVVGDPTDRATEVGPLVARRQQERVRGFITEARDAGARLVVGGPEQPAWLSAGWYVEPTLFDEVDPGSRVAREEVFGPVLTVTGYRDEAHAVELANDSDYGLSGSVWTGDAERGLDVARRVRTGSFGVNGPYSMDPDLPFGGMKGSGIGRELGPEGLAGYLELKTISGAC